MPKQWVLEVIFQALEKVVEVDKYNTVSQQIHMTRASSLGNISNLNEEEFRELCRLAFEIYPDKLKYQLALLSATPDEEQQVNQGFLHLAIVLFSDKRLIEDNTYYSVQFTGTMIWLTNEKAYEIARLFFRNIFLPVSFDKLRKESTTKIVVNGIDNTTLSQLQQNTKVLIKLMNPDLYLVTSPSTVKECRSEFENLHTLLLSNLDK